MKDFTAERARLIHHLGHDMRDKRVLDAMGRVPRELFVPEEYQEHAYDNKPLPIGLKQTISQPLIVAMMTESLELSGDEKVLEIGTGSGYQTAILAELAWQVITVERHPDLARRAKEILDRIGYVNVGFHLAGKALGWPPEAPYNAIIVTAGAPHVPQELLNQLADGGRLIIPVGPDKFEQALLKITRQNNEFITQNLGGCRFVPLIGEGVWGEEQS